mgnify:CR=1 FL=1
MTAYHQEVNDSDESSESNSSGSSHDIVISHITKTFSGKGKDVVALSDVSLNIASGTIFGIIGYSGGGKSTLVRCINGLEVPESGSVIVDGDDITKLSHRQLRERRKSIGMIFQRFNLLENATARGNVALALAQRGLSKAEVKARADALLGEVGLDGKEDSYPSQLSGGQQQRVAIARALANSPSILLCDEPTSALDPETTNSILELLRDLNRRLHLTIVIITHQMNVVTKICDRTAVISEGRIVEVGDTIDLFDNPKSPVTREFVNSFFQIKEAAYSFSSDYVRQAIEQGAKMVRFLFSGSEAYQAFISQASRKYGVEISIVYGSVRMVQDLPLGNLYVLLQGPETQVCGVFDFANEQQVQYEGLDKEALA